VAPCLRRSVTAARAECLFEGDDGPIDNGIVPLLLHHAARVRDGRVMSIARAGDRRDAQTEHCVRKIHCLLPRSCGWGGAAGRCVKICQRDVGRSRDEFLRDAKEG
jgi:hypothetical protein